MACNCKEKTKELSTALQDMKSRCAILQRLLDVYMEALDKLGDAQLVKETVGHGIQATVSTKDGTFHVPSPARSARST